jgi:hypothetical protein
MQLKFVTVMGTFECSNKAVGFIRSKEFIYQPSGSWFLKKDFAS